MPVILQRSHQEHNNCQKSLQLAQIFDSVSTIKKTLNNNVVSGRYHKITWMFHTTASLGQGFVYYCDKSEIPLDFGIWRGKKPAHGRGSMMVWGCLAYSAVGLLCNH